MPAERHATPLPVTCVDSAPLPESQEHYGPIRVVSTGIDQKRSSSGAAPRAGHFDDNRRRAARGRSLLTEELPGFQPKGARNCHFLL